MLPDFHLLLWALLRRFPGAGFSGQRGGVEFAALVFEALVGEFGHVGPVGHQAGLEQFVGGALGGGHGLVAVDAVGAGDGDAGEAGFQHGDGVGEGLFAGDVGGDLVGEGFPVVEHGFGGVGVGEDQGLVEGAADAADDFGVFFHVVAADDDAGHGREVVEAGGEVAQFCHEESFRELTRKIGKNARKRENDANAHVT